MTKLSVNVNKLATLRNSRGKNNPDLLKTTLDIISYGADGITVHPRPDEKHIRKKDVYAIANNINVEFNIEGYPDPEFLELIKDIKPTQCTLVPDPPDILTSNAGWQIEKNVEFLTKVIDTLHAIGVRTSLFVCPFHLSEPEIYMLKQIGTDRIELYTEPYANSYGTPDGENILARYQESAIAINAVGISINAGHDLNLLNLKEFAQAIPSLQEVSIGHALMCDALYLGLQETIKRYQNCLYSLRN